MKRHERRPSDAPTSPSAASRWLRVLLLAVGVTLTLVAWGVLLYAAVDFGQAAEKGQSSAWAFLAIAVIAASICLSLGLYLMVRVIRLIRGASASVALLATDDAAAPTHKGLAPEADRSSVTSHVADPVTEGTRDTSFVRPAEETPVEQTAERPALILDDESHEAELAEAAMLPRQRDHLDDDPTSAFAPPALGTAAADPQENAISRLMRHEPVTDAPPMADDEPQSEPQAEPQSEPQAEPQTEPQAEPSPTNYTAPEPSGQPVDQPSIDSATDSGWVARAADTGAVADPRESREAGPQRKLMDEIAARRAERAAAEEQAAGEPVADHDDTDVDHHETTGRRAAAEPDEPDEPDEEPPHEPYIGRRVKR